MAKGKQRVIAVIGLGTFGVQLCNELSGKGGKVLAIDNRERPIEKVKDNVSQSILMDSTNEEAMGQAPFEDVDTAIVAIGDNIQASIITTAILKRIGIPRIIARAVTEIHQQILRQVGADQIVNIEIDEGTRVAQQLISPDILDLIPISDVVSLGEVAVPADFVGKSLKDLDLRNRMKVGIVAIRRFSIGIDEGGNTVRNEQVVFPNADEVLEELDVLIIVGMNESIDMFKDL